MFSKILIANRGEIACRIIQTAHRMGIRVVAVYSDADRDAVHVEMADEAVLIGPAPAAESYLRADVIIDVARHAGAEQVFLEMRANNPAERLYRACGFEPIGRRPAYYRTLDGSFLDAITFARKL